MNVAWLMVLLALGVDPPYVRSRSETVGPAGIAACLHWAPGTLVLRQNQAGTPNVPTDALFHSVGRAIGNWEAEFARCGNLSVIEGPQTSTRTIGYRPDARDNENVILFRDRACTDVAPVGDPCWTGGSCGNNYDCWDHSQGTIALTTTSYDPRTGDLFDADIEANASAFFFTTVDSPQCTPDSVSASCVGFDVENTFTHELGHVVGLGHTNAPGSTMNPSAPLGETSKRIIDPGTLSFVCAAYPQGLPTDDCVPRDHLDGSSLNCSASSAPPGAALLVWLFWRGRRRLASATRDRGSGRTLGAQGTAPHQR